MKKDEVKVGGTYSAKVSGRLTVVRVDSISELPSGFYKRSGTLFNVTNTRTGRKTIFRSAAKFRGVAIPEGVAS